MKIVFDKINCISFSYFDTKPIGLLTRIFSLFRPNKLLRFHKKCLRMEFCKLFLVFYIFSNFQLKCLDFAHHFRTSLSKLLSNSLEEIVDDNFFQERNNLLFIFGLWPKFALTFYNDLSAGLPKLHLALLDEQFMQ